MSRGLRKPEQDLITQLKENVLTVVSFQCTDKLADFNDCRETGLKKDKRLKSIKDEEIKHYEVTKGCYDEYTNYIGCVKGVVNQVVNTKEILQLCNDKRIAFNQESLTTILMKDYKLI